MRILVTGGGGALGTALRPVLRQHGAVTVFDTAAPDDTEDAWIRGDVTDADDVTAAVEDHDLVVHMAAVTDLAAAEEDPWRCFDVNVEGTYHVCRAAAAADARVVLFSSREVYGAAEDAAEGDALAPRNVYGRSKLAAEEVVRQTCAEPLILRPTNVFGQGGDVVSTFAERIRADEELVLQGNPRMDLIHAADMAAVVDRLLDGTATGTYNVGSGQAYTLREVVEVLGSVHDGGVTVREADAPAYQTPRFSADVSAVLEETGYGMPDQDDRIRQVYRD